MSPSPLDIQQTTTVFSHFLIFANLLILISNHTAYRYDAYNMSEQLDWIPAITIRTYTMPWRGQVRTNGHPKFQCQWSDTFLSTGANHATKTQTLKLGGRGANFAWLDSIFSSIYCSSMDFANGSNALRVHKIRPTTPLFSTYFEENIGKQSWGMWSIGEDRRRSEKIGEDRRRSEKIGYFMRILFRSEASS